MKEISDLRKIYKESSGTYLNRRYSYKNRVRQCNFTSNSLKMPVSMCKKGFLFNHDSLSRALVRKNLPQRLNYIKSDEDIRQVSLSTNKTKKHRFPFCCPLTAKVLNGSNPFVLVWTCGCLMYEKLLFPLAAIRVSMETIEDLRADPESGSESLRNSRYRCPNCRKEFGLCDLYSLNLSTKKKSSEKAKKKETISKGKREIRVNLQNKRMEFETKNHENEKESNLTITLKRIKEVEDLPNINEYKKK